jgi:hypothetical protein
MKNILTLGILFLSLSSFSHANPLLLNQIQVIGTHNSYHVRPSQSMIDTAMSVSDEARSFNYSHNPLDVQLDNGVRSFELDIQPFEEGFQVMHVPVVDGESTCPVFKDCLSTVLAWSERHPNHIPVSFLLEIKRDEALLAGKPLRKLDAATLELLEQDVLSVIPREKILTPDDVRGDSPTLAQAVRERGWPPLKDTLGKLFFLLHDRDVADVYAEGHPSLKGRIMFVNSPPGRDDAAFMVINNPYAEKIPEYLALGLLLRVRADAGLQQGRKGDTSKRDTAFACGAQIISTDFPQGETCPDTGYVVAFPENAPARCGPLNSPQDCAAQLDALSETTSGK